MRLPDEELNFNFPILKKLSLHATASRKRFDMLTALVTHVEKRKMDKLENVELWFSDYEFNVLSRKRDALIKKLTRAGLSVSFHNKDLHLHDGSSRWNSWKADLLLN
ncbi:hypothetical protein BT69DRAFT_575261 [Atractiella rhizophila]|nr:hypothetical protein BT69DRAFT_575261 [Atractiella rhizophila]